MQFSIEQVFEVVIRNLYEIKRLIWFHEIYCKLKFDLSAFNAMSLDYGQDSCLKMTVACFYRPRSSSRLHLS